jgi:hypothetical protein
MLPSQLFQVSTIAPLLACASLLIFMKLSSAVPPRPTVAAPIHS